MRTTVTAPYGLLLLGDAGPDDLPPYDPANDRVLSTGRTLLVPVLPEVDGAVALDVGFDATRDLDPALTLVHEGPLQLPGRRLLCHDLRGGDIELLVVPAPDLFVVVAVDDPAGAALVVVRLAVDPG